ncbi:terminase small subunit [Edwardsiella ictaluri]|uniref:Terminase small subunit n=2 Tax=Edwardsiella ictaluri TaxID=67780 RepID=A0ABY8GGK1_EDWIC|nr:terminase small subunit [Edwardsiella ictaluri]WFN96471.1 terminase small subunit [Edwardsiella ictaluri]
MSDPSDKSCPAPGWLKKSDMAASLGISVQAFDKWGVIPVKKIGRNLYFDVRSVVDNRVENVTLKQQPTAPQDMSEDQLDYQRWRLTKEQADKAARENLIAERHQVPTEFATFALIRIAAKVSSLLDTVPLTIRRRYPELQTKHIEGIQRELVIASNEAAALGDLLPELLDEYIDSTIK